MSEISDMAHMQARFVLHELLNDGAPCFPDKITSEIMADNLPFFDWAKKPKNEITKHFTVRFIELYLEKSGEVKKKSPKANPEVVSRNKALLIRLLEHNKCDMALYPSGEHTDKFSNFDKATGVWPHKFSQPIMFSDDGFLAKMREASHDPRFKTYTKATWDSDFATKDTPRTDSEDTTRPEIPRMTMEELNAKARSILEASKNSPSPYAGMDLPQILRAQRAK